MSIASGVISSILGNSVSTGELDNNSVTSVKLADGSIITSKIVDGSVIAAKIGDGSVTESKLAANSVSTAKIIDSAVTFNKIQAVNANSLIGNPAGSPLAEPMSVLARGLLLIQAISRARYTNSFCCWSTSIEWRPIAHAKHSSGFWLSERIPFGI